MAPANKRAPSFTIAVDVMGSDYAPAEVVKGAVETTQGGRPILGGDGGRCHRPRTRQELTHVTAG